MKIKQRENNGIVVLDVSGEMYGGPDNMKLADLVNELGEGGKLDVIVKCEKVKWISSTGIGILVTARNRFAKHGGRLKLCNLNKKVLSVLQITQLNLVLEIHETEEDAVSAVSNES